MDRSILQAHLTQAEEHVALGETHLARQRNLIATLRRDGQDVSAAIEFLGVLERSQAVHVAHRNRLLRDIAALDSAP